MKRNIILFAALASVLFPLTVPAIPASQKPVRVTQPDGSKIEIRIHGDEYLNWTTCGGSLVSKGKDGYFHYAEFQTDGNIVIKDGKVGAYASFGNGMDIVPPIAATEKAAAQKTAKAMTRTWGLEGEKRYLVMLIEFSDLTFTAPDANDRFSRMLNQKGYADNGGTGSVKDYYEDQSLEQFHPVFDVVGPVNVGHRMSSYSNGYGMTKYGAPRLLAEACELADDKIDFSIYDNDGDGTIDNVFFFFAGHNYAEGADGTIWPHADYVNYKTFTFDGVTLSRYACTSEYKGADGTEIAGIGNFCHEFAHVLGLPDLYDTYNNMASGPGEYSLMHNGCFNNNGNTPPSLSCEEKKILGWVSHVPQLGTKSADYTLASVSHGAGFTSPTENSSEYYYYEYRDGSGWDSPLPEGLLIYHVDRSLNTVKGKTAAYRWKFQEGINGDPSHQCYYLIEADAESGTIPFGGYYSDYAETISWSGNESGFKLSDIQTDGNKAQFHIDYSGPAENDIFYKLGLSAIDIGDGKWKAGDTFTPRLIKTEQDPVSVQWYYDGDPIDTDSIVLTHGTHKIKTEYVLKDGSTGSYEAEINID